MKKKDVSRKGAKTQGKQEGEFDVAIVGGGLTGASLAVALPATLRVALIEAAPFPESRPNWDERMLGLNDASRRIFESLGLWGEIEREAEPIRSTHISERGRFGVARFTAEEAGVPALGYNTPVRAIGAALWRRVSDAPNVTVFCPAKIEGVAVGEASVSLTVSAQRSALSARLVVAADGAQSAVRGLLGIGAEERDYGQVAVVGSVRPERPHQGVAYERFTPEGPIALLPRPEKRCTLIWTVSTAKSRDVLGWSDAEFLEQLQEAFGQRLGRLLETGRRQGYPLTRVLSDQITAPRVLFAGNAAQTLHPVAAQGFNLGVRDIATVAELLADAGDPGAPAILAEYERRRTGDRERVSAFTDRLVRTFSNDIPGLRAARHLGLLALDLFPPVKREVMRQNLGYSGTTPALARRARTPG